MVSIHVLLLTVSVLSIVLILRCIWTIVYRLFFHPLAHLPGPLLARATHLYAFWYNMQGGSFYLQIQKLHEQYGMSIVPCDTIDSLLFAAVTQAA